MYWNTKMENVIWYPLRVKNKCKCLKELKKGISILKKQTKQQALEILRLNRVVERHTDPINRLNQSQREVERKLNMSFNK